MAIPSNVLQTVTTYQETGLPYLENLLPICSAMNAKFKDFQTKTANLGQSVNLELPPDSVSADGLVASFQPSIQLLATLTCDQAKNVSRDFTNQQEVFNLDADSYMEKFGKADVEELANAIEINVAKNFDSSVPVMAINSQGQSVPTGALHFESGPYRFFSDGITPINSYQQLEEAHTSFAGLGTLPDIYVILPNKSIPKIIGTGLNQFVPERNNKDAMSWDLGEFGYPRVKYLRSNILPIHTSGVIGNETFGSANNFLTVVSTNDPTGQNITQIVCTTPVSDTAKAIRAGDLGVFVDGVSGQINMRYLTYRGHAVSSEPVQIRMNVDADSVSTAITISITPALVSAPGSGQNLNTPITAGMQIQIMPNHRCGMLVAGNAGYLAMPMLPDEVPYPTASKNDPTTGLSLRTYYGSRFGANQRGMVTDGIWGSLFVPKYCMRLLFPTNV